MTPAPIDPALVISEVQRISAELYPAPIACTGADYTRHKCEAAPSLHGAVRQWDGHWCSVVEAAGLRCESRSYYMTLNVQRRENAERKLNDPLAEDAVRYRDAEDEPLTIAEVRRYRQNERVVQRNGKTLKVYEEVTVLR